MLGEFSETIADYHPSGCEKLDGCLTNLADIFNFIGKNRVGQLFCSRSGCEGAGPLISIMKLNTSKNRLGSRLVVCAVAVRAFCGTTPAQSGYSNAAPSSVFDATNAPTFLRASLLLQEQLHDTQQAIERNRLEAEAALTHNTEAITAQLNLIQRALETQRERDLETMRSSNRFMLILACGFAGVGMLAMLLTAYLQWRAVHRLGEIPTTLPPAHLLGSTRAIAALGAGDAPVALAGAAEQSNARLLAVIERLEKRISELERFAQTRQATADSIESGSRRVNTDSTSGIASYGQASEAPEANDRKAQAVTVMGKGQSLLNLGQAEEALACFDEALGLDPANAEAFIKKGTVLEKLDRLEEALACYDCAIKADGSVTLAYLHKGSLFNRMARYNEALACYEQALKTQGRARAA
jgi:tetratricopeptide (TPR) repeat protein